MSATPMKPSRPVVGLSTPSVTQTSLSATPVTNTVEPSSPSVTVPHNTGIYKHRILVGVPTMGTVRIEWHNAIAGIVVPCNWSNSMTTPIGFLVADAQNIIARECLLKDFEWLLLIEDDTLPPPDILLKLVKYMDAKEVPVVSALYHLKGSKDREPLMYRGRGNGAYRRWKPGEQVWVDGVPTGCVLIHASLIKAYATEPDIEEYTLHNNGEVMRLQRIFESPRRVSYSDINLMQYNKMLGTSDLYFCDEVIRRKLLKKAGWGKIAAKEYPFLVDTSIRCGHIDRETGVIW